MSRQPRIPIRISAGDSELLEIIAREHGFRDAHTYLHRQVNALPGLIKKQMICGEGMCKIKKPIPVSEEVLEFYEKLACVHSTTIVSIVNKYILYPAIREYMIIEQTEPPTPFLLSLS